MYCCINHFRYLIFLIIYPRPTTTTKMLFRATDVVKKTFLVYPVNKKRGYRVDLSVVFFLPSSDTGRKA